MKKTREYKISLYQVFIDCTKSFDLLRHTFLVNVLRNQVVSNIVINITKNSYIDLKARIITDKNREIFQS